jgi:hypothetical protein
MNAQVHDMKAVIHMPAAQALHADDDRPLIDTPPQRSSRSRTASPTERSPAAAHSPFVPLLLGGLALMGWLGWQTLQLVSERNALQGAHAAQQQTVDNAAKLRASLDALAADTQRMALAGNPSAKLLVDELARRGVTITAPASTATTPAAAPPAAR